MTFFMIKNGNWIKETEYKDGELYKISDRVIGYW